MFDLVCHWGRDAATSATWSRCVPIDTLAIVCDFDSVRFPTFHFNIRTYRLTYFFFFFGGGESRAGLNVDLMMIRTVFLPMTKWLVNNTMTSPSTKKSRAHLLVLGVKCCFDGGLSDTTILSLMAILYDLGLYLKNIFIIITKCIYLEKNKRISFFRRPSYDVDPF